MSNSRWDSYIWSDFFFKLLKEPYILERTQSGDETWVFQYDPENFPKYSTGKSRVSECHEDQDHANLIFWCESNHYITNLFFRNKHQTKRYAVCCSTFGERDVMLG
jgi:hypothetical protein